MTADLELDRDYLELALSALLRAALYLQRAGLPVSVIDPLPPGGQGVLRQRRAAPCVENSRADRDAGNAPKRCRAGFNDPLGPLAVRPSYLPKALP